MGVQGGACRACAVPCWPHFLTVPFSFQVLYTQHVLPSGRRVGVVNTHLQADAVFASAADCAAARRAQFGELTAYLQARSRGRGVDKLVAAGDMNLPCGHAQFETWTPRAGTAPTHDSGRALDAV